MAPATLSTDLAENPSIALALSGGGSRAIAFHLGCLRALHNRGVLDKVRVLSAVSGGAVIGALYAYSTGTFHDFDAKIVELLRQGLEWSILRHLFTPHLLGQVLLTNLLARPGAWWAARMGKQSSPRRWASRTDAFELALAEELFGDKLVTSPRRNDIDVVLNACELRTGTAFRFGSRESASWRTGAVVGNQLAVATAVAASAAYPLILPALDREYLFAKNNMVDKRRVLLTDGGVYDNLGITCLEPGRDAEYSFNIFHPDVILCCSAGDGLFDDQKIPWGFRSRITRSLGLIHRKVQDAAMKRLHEHKESGRLQGFLLAYLGQQDNKLPMPQPANFVSRDQTFGYPTNFRAMKPESLHRLSTRGEQLAAMLLQHYLPNL